MSMSLNFNYLWDGANNIINGLSPVYLVIVGFTFGVGILTLIARQIGGAFKGRL